MSLSRYKLAAVLAVVAGVSGAGTAAAGSADYYVHYTVSFDDDNASTSITVDAPGGTTLVRPAAACGMRFEYPGAVDWQVPIFGTYDSNTTGAINVWLPGPGCGAWNNVVLEPDDSDADDITWPPQSVPGTLRVLDAKAYWIDSGGDKLIYKHCCGSETVYGPEAWTSLEQAPAELDSVKRLLLGTTIDPGAFAQLALSERVLLQMSRDLQVAVARRREIPAVGLEGALRGLEDGARAWAGEALAQQRACRANLDRGDRQGAYIACDLARSAARRARAALHTVDTWSR